MNSEIYVYKYHEIIFYVLKYQPRKKQNIFLYLRDLRSIIFIDIYIILFIIS